jgi:hypothetical protein
MLPFPMLAANPASVSKSVPVSDLCALCVSVFSSLSLPFDFKLSTVNFLSPIPLRIRTFVKSARNPFRMRSFKTKDLKLFRMSIYEKTGGGVPPARDAGLAEGEERSLHCGRDDRPPEE